MSRASRMLNRQSGRYMSDATDNGAMKSRRRNNYFSSDSVQKRKDVIDSYRKSMERKDI